MKYIFNGATHSDASSEYLTSLGMNAEQIESINNQLAFELQQNQEIAKKTRNDAINADLDVGGRVFQVGAKARDNLNEAINKCQRDQLPESESRDWILADNKVASVTFADLKEVMNAYATRMDVIFQAYALWRAGNKKELFSV